MKPDRSHRPAVEIMEGRMVMSASPIAASPNLPMPSVHNDSAEANPSSSVVEGTNVLAVTSTTPFTAIPRTIELLPSLASHPASDTPVAPATFRVTHRIQSEVHAAIAKSFDRFEKAYLGALEAYKKSTSKPRADTVVPSIARQDATDAAFTKLSGDLNVAARKLPAGGRNLYPILRGLSVGSFGVTDSSTNKTTESLETHLLVLGDSATTKSLRSAIVTTESASQADANLFIKDKGVLPNLTTVVLYL